LADEHLKKNGRNGVVRLKIQDMYYNQGKAYWHGKQVDIVATPNLEREGRNLSKKTEVVK